MLRYILSRLAIGLVISLLLAFSLHPCRCADGYINIKAVVNLSTLVVTIISTDQCFPIGVGKKVLDKSLTPIGIYKVIAKARRAGQDAFGTRVLVLDCHIHNQKHVCIHGTDQPELIKLGFISHGCIRLCNEDVEQLYNSINIGDYIEIKD